MTEDFFYDIISIDLFLKTFKKILKEAYDTYGASLNDDLPHEIRMRYRLISAEEAVLFSHFPQNKEQVRQAKRRIKYEELLKFQLKLQYLRYQTKIERQGAEKVFDETRVETFIKNLPFTLTDAQQKVLQEIKEDLKLGSRMNRLLQGDVGSGKTVVAAISLLMVN